MSDGFEMIYGRNVEMTEGLTFLTVIFSHENKNFPFKFLSLRKFAFVFVMFHSLKHRSTF
jgi:hypothetical protein